MALLLTNALLIAVWLLPRTHPVAAEVDTSSQSISLQGAGSTIPMTLYQSALFSYRFVDPSIQTKFYSSTNDQALCRLLNNSECASSDTALLPSHLDWGSMATLPSSDMYRRYPDLQLYPTVASAVVPIYHIKGVTDLVLTMSTLAKIWSGRITNWDHPDIQATNPNFSSWNVPANQPITLVARADSAGTTQVFKLALAGADPVFRAQVGTASAPTWNGTQVMLASGSQLVSSAVMRGSYTLGYVPRGFALANAIPVARLNRSGVLVEASTASVQYALLERGLSFGNNGDNPAHLTGDLVNAVNPLAWPITSYSYMAVRKTTLRPGTTCATMAALVNYWMWFWTSNDVAALAPSLGFSILPAVVRDFVVARFAQDLVCGGRVLWQEAVVQPILGYGPESAGPIFDKFQQAYALVNSSVSVNYTVFDSDDQDVTPLLGSGAFVVSTAPLSSSTDVVSLVMACEALVAVSQYTLTLDGLTLAKILNGDIKTWLHPDIRALNPHGVLNSAGQALNDTSQRIILLQGPTARSTPLTTLLQRFYSAYTGTAIQAAESFTNEVQLQSSVLGTPYSFSVTALAGDLPAELQAASMVPVGGSAMAPSLATAQACTSHALYDPNAKRVSFDNNNGGCYPLLLTLYVSMQRQCTASATTAQAVAFVQWMFSGAALDAALDALNLASFYGTSSAIQAANSEALFRLSCKVRPTPSTPTDLLPLLLGVIVPVVVVVLAGGSGCGWWMWRVTENNRAIRKKFSNDNVAESCAEAIARFDLAAVAWLQEVKEPNKIQLAFLAIIGLLTEVKPYIPDQLLSHLTASKTGACDAEEDEEADRKTEMSSPRVRSQCPSVSESFRRGRQSLLYTPRSVQSLSPTNCRRTREAHRSIVSSEGTQQVLAMKDWHRKRCTFMCIRFGSTYHHADRRLLGLIQVAGRIVDVAKANGATIDAVGVDFVTVHWGVTATHGASATKAVHVGLEVAKLRDHLPEEQQEAFWLQMGVGKGLCDCGTVSSESGHRYFVVWGTEASLALEIAMTSLPKRVLSSLLVSPSVYQEVQFTVQFMPRLWHEGVLLWEPLCETKKDEDDEWMYELKKMNDASALRNKTLLDVFLLAKGENASATDLSTRIAELRSVYGGTMSAQDSASLDLLVSAVGARTHDVWNVVLDDVVP